VLVIPSERSKTDAAQTVLLTKTALALLETLPRFDRGDHIFSTQAGAKGVCGFSRLKERLDTITTRLNGGIAIPEWRFHDVRRSVRTQLSTLGVRDDVAEMVLGHALKGVRRVYDRHRYDSEKRDALTRWEIALNAIANGQPDNVVPLRRPGPESEQVQPQLASPGASPDVARGLSVSANPLKQQV
jgi:integrase